LLSQLAYWPASFHESEAWPLPSLRQSFLNGALTRLVDPDTTLRSKIQEFVEHEKTSSRGATLAASNELDGGKVSPGEKARCRDRRGVTRVMTASAAPGKGLGYSP